jgi:hypothetical protein
MKNPFAKVTLVAAIVLAGCAAKPPVPDWQINSKSASDRFIAAYLTGNTRLEAFEFERARREVSSTGRLDLLARLELLRCAARAASAVFEPCTAFEVLRADASAEDRAYGDYLRGQVSPASVPLLPASQRPVASALAGSAAGTIQLTGIDDPLARLVAAGVLLQQGQANPSVIQQAVDTASSQGWRRPLLAWLGMQLQRAEQAPGGAGAEQAVQLKRRIALVQVAPADNSASAPSPKAP